MSIPLSYLLDTLVPLSQAPKGKTSIKIMKKIIGNVLAKPHEGKYRKLNATKLVPKLTAENQNLAPIYILEHAGFVKQNDKYVLKADADLQKMSSILAAIEQKLGGTTAAPVASQPATIGGVDTSGMTQKQIDALAWEMEKKRLEEVADKRKKERDARRAKEAAERKIREAKEAEERKAREAKEAEERVKREAEEKARREAEEAELAKNPQKMEEEEPEASVPEGSKGEVSAPVDMELDEASKKAEDKSNETETSEQQGIDVSTLPPKSSLDSKQGKKDGEVQCVNEDGKAMAYQWKNNQWNLLGEATGMKPKKSAAELDEEMKSIVSNIISGKGVLSTALKAKKKKSKKPANFAQMTLEEKHAYAKKEREKKARKLEKRREKNRQELGKAQAHLAEQNEWQKLKAAAAKKKKEEREARKARKRILAKMKRDRERKNREIAEQNKRLLAEQEERRRQGGYS